MTTTVADTDESSMDAATQSLHLSYLRQMLLIRRFEEKAGEAYTLGKIGGFCHLCIGQEAVAVGVMAALGPEDQIVTAYRDHGHALARGLTSRSVMAELFGKSTGCSAGKGGSMHLFDVSHGFLGGHGIVGSHIPLAAGVAFAQKYRGSSAITVCLFGEAAANIGAFHEAMNMAALWGLPCVFVLENNGYGMGTAQVRASSVQNLAIRAGSYGMAAERVDGQDVLIVRAAMDRAVQRARTEGKPSFLEMITYRYVGHSMSDAPYGTYRTKEEVEGHRSRDPIAVLATQMEKAGHLDKARYDALDAEVLTEVEDAIKFSDESPEPDPAELHTHVYAPENQ